LLLNIGLFVAKYGVLNNTVNDTVNDGDAPDYLFHYPLYYTPMGMFYPIHY